MEDDRLYPETLTHQKTPPVIAIDIIEFLSLSAIFSFSGFSRKFSVFAIVLCDLITSISLFWYVDWFLRNYPLHMVFSLRALRPCYRDLPIQYLNPFPKHPRTTDMTPSRKNVTQATTVVPTAPKGKGKLSRILSMWIVDPTYPTFTSLTLKILIQTLHRYGGCRPPNLSPSPTANSSSRCFPLCGSRWRTSRLRWSNSRRLFVNKNNNPYLDTTAQTIGTLQKSQSSLTAEGNA